MTLKEAQPSACHLLSGFCVDLPAVYFAYFAHGPLVILNSTLGEPSMWQQEPFPRAWHWKLSSQPLVRAWGWQEVRPGFLDLHAQGPGGGGGAASTHWCGINPCHSCVPSAIDVKRKTRLCFRVKTVMFLTRVCLGGRQRTKLTWRLQGPSVVCWEHGEHVLG